MEFKIELGGGPVVWSISLIAFDLDTGKDVGWFMLNSCYDLDATKNYVNGLQRLTGFDVIVNAKQEYIEEGDVCGLISVTEDFLS